MTDDTNHSIYSERRSIERTTRASLSNRLDIIRGAVKALHGDIGTVDRLIANKKIYLARLRAERRELQAEISEIEAVLESGD